MREDLPALRTAIELLHVPSRVHLARTSPLPAGVPRLLLLAAGDPEALAQDAIQTGRTEALLGRAARFYIEQVLLAPDADSYRILGAEPTASLAELRKNMALLLRSLHPDTAAGMPQSVFATRVTGAWETLKTDERRIAYDLSRQAQKPAPPRWTLPAVARPERTFAHAGAAPAPTQGSGLVARVIRALLGPDVS
jgi:hypothetical protein